MSDLRFTDSPETGGPSSEPIQAIRSRMWLRAMIDQGEDRIWRGAEGCMRYLTQTEIERDELREAFDEIVEAVQLEADSENGISGQLSEALRFSRAAQHKISVIRAEKSA